MSRIAARFSYALAPLVVIASCATLQPKSEVAPASGPWLQYADVRQAGFDAEALSAVCERADRLESGAVMAVYRGRVILACGDVSRDFESHSVRKSLVSALYGTAVARGEISLDTTLADASIDDLTSLTPTERSATLRQVISARSGVFLPAAYGASQDRRRPARGSHAPGSRWFYNNWDFNIAGVVYERATREDLYESFERRIAKLLGMEDWTPGDGFRVYEPTKSRHPAHTFRISARDLARFGQLYLQEGKWEESQILPADWVKESTRPHTDDGDGTGYGYMWWTYQPGPFTAQYPALAKYTFYRAVGTGEQALSVIPGVELVVVHRADTDHDRRVDGQDQWRLVESIVAAKKGEPTSTPELRALAPVPLRSQLPARAIPVARGLDANVLTEYLGDYQPGPGATRVGDYELTAGAAIRVFVFEGNPYLHLPGVGDVQMFAGARDTFTSRILLDLETVFERASDGTVSAVAIGLGGARLRAARSTP